MFYEIICRYNSRAKEWVESGINEFKDLTFTTNGVAMAPSTETSGKYYPVRDSCEKDGDPEDKCVYTQAYYYQSYIPVSSGFVTASVFGNTSSIVNQQYESMHTEVYSESQLGCTDDEYDTIFISLL